MENGQSAMRISADAMVALVVAEAEARELAGMPPLRELNAAFEPSSSFLRRMRKLLRRARNARRGKKLRKAAKRTLLCGAAMLVLLCGGMMQVEAVREAVISTLIEWNERFARIRYPGSTSTGAILPERIELGYIPEGFVVQQILPSDGFSFIVSYGNGTDDFTLQLSVVDGQNETAVDNEHTAYYTVQFDGHDALWCASDKGYDLLLWKQNGIAWHISGTLGLAELIRIAEGITL